MSKSIKAGPNLPSSSIMQMASTGGSLTKQTTEYGGMKRGKATENVKKVGVASKITGSAVGKKGIKGTNPYKK